MKVILMVAVTIDGRIAEKKSELIDWTSKEDKKIFANITKDAGVIIFGENTYKTIGKPLSKRLNIVLTKNKSFKEQSGVLETYSGEVKKLLQILKKRGFKKCVVAGGNEVYRQFLDAELVDELIITYVPIILGKGLSFGESIKQKKKFKLVSEGVLSSNSGEIIAKYKYINKFN